MTLKQSAAHFFLITSLFILLTLSQLSTFSFADGDAQKVLILHWQDSFTIGVMNMDQILYEDLLDKSGQPIEIYSEYLQFSKFTNMDIQVDTLELLKKKYAQLGLDLIITTDDPDYQLAISYRNELFPNVPIVFIGVNKDTIFASQLQPNTTGNYKLFDIDSSIANIEHLFPDTKNLVVISGAGRQDSQYYRVLKEGLTAYSERFNISYTVDMTLPQILELIAELPPQTCVIYTSMFNDAAGTGFNPPLVAIEIAKYSNSPVFVYSQNMIGSGVIGGNVIDFTALAHDGASRAIKILNGTLPSSIPIKTPPNINYFDADVLKKYGINEKTLPSGSVFLERNADGTKSRKTIDHYQPLIFLLIGSCFGSVMVIGILLIRQLYNRSNKS